MSKQESSKLNEANMTHISRRHTKVLDELFQKCDGIELDFVRNRPVLNVGPHNSAVSSDSIIISVEGNEFASGGEDDIEVEEEGAFDEDLSDEDSEDEEARSEEDEDESRSEGDEDEARSEDLNYDDDIADKESEIAEATTKDIDISQIFGKILGKHIKGLRDICKGHNQLPDIFQRTPKPHQISGAYMVKYLCQSQYSGGMLCDPMGSGKSFTAIISYLLMPRGPQHGPLIIVTKLSLVSKWQDEIKVALKLNHQLKVLVLPSKTKVSAQDIYHYDVVLTHYEYLRQESLKIRTFKDSFNTLVKPSESELIDTKLFNVAIPDVIILSEVHNLNKIKFGVVLDESHTIKNLLTDTYQAVASIQRLYTLFITADPMPNTWTDMNSPLSLLANLPFIEKKIFNHAFCKEVDNSKGSTSSTKVNIRGFKFNRLKKLLYGLMVRRPDIILNLSPWDIQDVEFELEGISLEHSNECFDAFKKGSDDEGNRLANLTRSMQWSIHPKLVAGSGLGDVEVTEKDASETSPKNSTQHSLAIALDLDQVWFLHDDQSLKSLHRGGTFKLYNDQSIEISGEGSTLNIRSITTFDEIDLPEVLPQEQLEKMVERYPEFVSSHFIRLCFEQMRLVLLFAGSGFHDLVDSWRKLCDDSDEMTEDKSTNKNDSSAQGFIVAGLHSSRMKAFGNTFNEFKRNLPNQRLIIAAENIGPLEIVAQILNDNQIEFDMYTGNLTPTQRDKALMNFKKSNPGSRVLLLTADCGGLGIDIVEASLIIQLEVWWNVAKELQLYGRCQRYGQVHQVIIRRLVAKNAKVDCYRKQNQLSKLGPSERLLQDITKMDDEPITLPGVARGDEDKDIVV